MEQKNYYIYTLNISKKTWSNIISNSKKILNVDFKTISKEEKEKFLKHCATKFVYEFSYNFNYFKDKKTYFYIPTYYYCLKEISEENINVDIYFYKERKQKNLKKLQNISFNFQRFNRKCSLLKAFDALNNDLTIYIKNANYYLENANLIGDFEIKHSIKKYQYLDFSGILNLEDYPFFKQLDTSKFNKKQRVFNFKIKNKNDEFNVKIKLNSHFKNHSISNAQLISELSLNGIKNIKQLIKFKKEILDFKAENKHKLKVINELIKIYKKNYKFNLNKSFINKVKIGFRKIASCLNYFKNDSLINIITEESIAKRFYLLYDENTAKYYAEISLFYNLNYEEIIDENYAYIKFCNKFQNLKNINLFLINCESFMQAKFEFLACITEIFDLFERQKNT
ncbi:hypothetical protein [Mycoplasma phocimorsus]|uniref:hypothetical protein n=1 Tax=Mycoplasma phocimorsus TaxID=3045839 RepID=UPI0024C0039C|nr:hypothetical protein [Mycoplasma phocimorsus]MDJ1647098.1 hypothetical protein [Mycoplasma phocimorsus]